MARRIVLAFSMVVLLVGGAAEAFAGSSQSTFSISPPPIATPVFGVKETDVKLGATYLSMKSTGTGTSFKLTGSGINFVGRTALGEQFAFDYAAGIFILTGNMNMGGAGASMSMAGMTVPYSFNLEYQPVKNNVFNLILFAGPAFTLSMMDVDINAGIGSNTITTTSVLYGPQGGIQMGVTLHPFHIDAFGTIVSQQGSQSSTDSYNNTTSASIPAYTTQSYGADLTYIPWGLALSTLLQKAKQGDNNGFKTTLYQLSWSHTF